MGTQVVGKSNSVEYSTPLKIVQPLINEFGLTKDVCASALIWLPMCIMIFGEKAKVGTFSVLNYR